MRAQKATLVRAGMEVIEGVSTGSNVIALMPDLRVNNFELRSAFDAYLIRRGPDSPVKSFMDRLGLPIAIEFLGRPFAEHVLIAIASAYQRANPVRVAPASTPRRPADTIRY